MAFFRLVLFLGLCFLLIDTTASHRLNDKPFSARLPGSEPSVSSLDFSLVVSRVHKAIPAVDASNVSFSECGTVNAFYSPRHKKIKICVELVDYLLAKEAGDAARVVVFVLGHELGHYFLDAKGHPVVREEDVADSYAVWWAPVDVVEAGMRWMASEAIEELENPLSIAYEDEHSPWAIRYYNARCWLYGRTGNSDYAEGLGWRAPRCLEEWIQIDRLWSGLR